MTSHAVCVADATSMNTSVACTRVYLRLTAIIVRTALDCFPFRHSSLTHLTLDDCLPEVHWDKFGISLHHMLAAKQLQFNVITTTWLLFQPLTICQLLLVNLPSCLGKQ